MQPSLSIEQIFILAFPLFLFSFVHVQCISNIKFYHAGTDPTLNYFTYDPFLAKVTQGKVLKSKTRYGRTINLNYCEKLTLLCEQGWICQVQYVLLIILTLKLFNQPFADSTYYAINLHKKIQISDCDGGIENVS